MTIETHQIVDFLLLKKSYPHPCSQVLHLETHISHIFLAGEYAYKLKKPVHYDFLNFSTKELRKKFCFREVELNRRYAPDLYLGVLGVFTNGSSLRLAPIGDAATDDDWEEVDYLVQMKRFDESSLLIHLARSSSLKRAHITTLAKDIAALHRGAMNRPEFGTPEIISRHCQDNFSEISRLRPACISPDLVEKTSQLSDQQLQQVKPVLTARASSHVRELHGDLHLKNIYLENDKPQMFDGIEFSDEYLCGDVWSDVAFLAMDLMHHEHPELAGSLINQYLEETDDFEGLALLPLYISYRAAVRAKVNLLKSCSIDADVESLYSSAQRHLKLAERALTCRSHFVIAVGGLSGSGKTTLARELSELLGAVHIRTDVVRKHTLQSPVNSKLPGDVYSENARLSVYSEVIERAHQCVKSGRSVLLDGTFTRRESQALAKKFAEDNSLSFVGIWCNVSEETAKIRITSRRNDASDADAAVFDKQKETASIPSHWYQADTSGAPDSTAKSIVSRHSLLANFIDTGNFRSENPFLPVDFC